jgi:hypothetical protein
VHKTTTAQEWAQTIIKALPQAHIIAAFQEELEALWQKDQRMRWTKAATAAAYLKGHAKALGLPLPTILKMALQVPTLFNNRPDKVLERSEGLRLLFALGQDAHQRLIRQNPVLLTRNPEQFEKRVDALAALLKVPKEKAVRMCLQEPSIGSYTTDYIESKLEELSKALHVPRAQVERDVVRWPQVLTISAKRISEFTTTLAEATGMSLEAALTILRKRPAIMTTPPRTLASHIIALAELLNLSAGEIIELGTRFPAVLYLRPTSIHQTLAIAAARLNVPLELFVNAAKRSPTLVARKPLPMARKYRLAIRIALFLGHIIDARDALARFPSLGTYAMDRLLVRYWMARHGLGPRSWANLIRMNDKQCMQILRNHGITQNCEQRIEEIIQNRIL